MTSTSTAAGGRSPGTPVSDPDDKTTLPPGFVLEQPPARLAHLTGDRLYEALCGKTENELWNRDRVAAETGRSVLTVNRWVHARESLNKWEAGRPGARPAGLTDRTIPQWKAKYGRGAEVWEARDIRRWAMKVGLTTREGKFVPHSPTGNKQDVTAGKIRVSEVRDIGPIILAEFNALRADDVTTTEAHQRIRDKHGLTPARLLKRLEAGRQIARPTAGEFFEAYQRERAAGLTTVQAVTALAGAYGVPELDVRSRVWMGARTARNQEVRAEVLGPNMAT